MSACSTAIYLHCIFLLLHNDSNNTCTCFFIVKHSHIFYSQVQSMSSSMTAEWDEENTRIVTNLMVTQVRAGNRPNKILTPSAFDEVAFQFKVRTGLDIFSLPQAERPQFSHCASKDPW